MAQVSGWLGAGLLTAGVSAAVLAGAGAAHADTEGDSDAGTASTSAVSSSKPAAGPKRTVGSASESDNADSSGTDAQDGDNTEDEDSLNASPQRDVSSTDAASSDVDDEDVATDEDVAIDDGTESEDRSSRADQRDDEEGNPVQSGGAEAPSAPTAFGASSTSTVSVSPAVKDDAAEPGAAAGGIGDIIGPFQPDYPPLTRVVGSAIFNLIGAVVQLFDGPPAVPKELRDSIKVGSSSLVISPGNNVAADWYFPTSGQPARLIYLQHGILASAPMYSHTAAYLAERTNSVVVATTLTSNPFADGNMWLGGDDMHKAVAQLFLDDSRAALNASFVAAALKQGVTGLTVPTEFVLVGHSLGGGFGPGVAGHYAEGLVARRAEGRDAPNDLAGVTLLDAVPFSPIMPNAMERLKALEASGSGDPDDYIPVYEIGAPLNFLNSNSRVNEELSEARPGKFNGVVVDDGVHMDGMLGGNPVIQFSAYLVAGFPRPQNPPAVQLLMAGWINDMFAGSIDPTTGRCLGEGCKGQYGNSGETIIVPTDKGDASMVVIDSGALPADRRQRANHFEPLEVSSIGDWLGRRVIPAKTA